MTPGGGRSPPILEGRGGYREGLLLEKAIEIVLAALAEDPPVTPKRPPFPLRARPTP